MDALDISVWSTHGYDSALLEARWQLFSVYPYWRDFSRIRAWAGVSSCRREFATSVHRRMVFCLWNVVGYLLCDYLCFSGFDRPRDAGRTQKTPPG